MSRRLEKCHSRAKLTLIQIKADAADCGRNRNELEIAAFSQLDASFGTSCRTTGVAAQPVLRLKGKNEVMTMAQKGNLSGRPEQETITLLSRAEKDFPKLDWLRRAHTEQLALCRELEEIADSLPSNVNRQKCIYAAKALGPVIRGAHHYEETVLFPWIEHRTGQRARSETLERLRFEHFEDECFAEELTDALLKVGSGNPVNMEAVGYMLRGFFEATRRHIAFESDCLLEELENEQTH